MHLSRRDSTELAEAYARWIGRQLDSDAGQHVGAAIMEPVLQVPKWHLECRNACLSSQVHSTCWTQAAEQQRLTSAHQSLRCACH